MREAFIMLRKQQLNGWLLTSLLGSAVILLPILYIMVSIFSHPNENWQHIKQYMLKDYILQSIFLVTFTGFFTVAIGVILAWLLTTFDFPLKRFFSWALVLPLAIPPYIAAYTYSNMLSYTGFLQVTLRNHFGLDLNQNLFDVMSMQGAVFIFTMFLFPYVFIITRSFLENQSASYIETAKLLGKTPISIFFQVVLPISRPAVTGGIMLVVFEVLSDYGVASYFGIQTFSTAIFQTWFGMYDIQSAMRLAAWLMVGVVGLFLIERTLRRDSIYYSSTSKMRPLEPQRLHGFYAIAATLFCILVFAFSFLIPVLQLLIWATWTYQDVLTSGFLEMTYHTLSIAFFASVIIMILSMIVGNVCRLYRSSFSYALSKIVTAGYSIPGAVIAIGVLALFISLDHTLAPLYEQFGMGSSPLVLSMSLIMLVFAYVIRFMATGFNAVEAGFERVGLKYVEASRMLGHGITKTFFKVDIYMIKGAVLSGFILTFVEIIKELPLALLLRPFNFETLATKSYQYASDERIIEASVPSLLIICISLISVFVLHQFRKRISS